MADNGVTPGDWVRLVSRLRLDEVVPGVRKGAFLKGTTVKAVAYALASYADYSDGTNVRPGVARIAMDCEISYPFASRCIAGLRELGLIALMRKGTQDGRADEYRLAPPEEWPEHLDVPTPTAYDLMVRRLAEANRRRPRTPAADRSTATVDNSPVPLPQTGVRVGSPDTRTPAGSTADSHVPLPEALHVPLPEAGATEAVTETPSLTETDEGDLRTGVAVVGCPQPEETATDRRYRKAIEEFPSLVDSGLSRTAAIKLADVARHGSGRRRRFALIEIASYARRTA